MKSILILSVTLLFTFPSFSQVGIGTPLPNGALDITASNEGLLIPRVALSSTATVLPIITGTTSELIYNTASVSDVTPGFYYLSTNTGPWVRLGTSATGWNITGNTGIINGTNFIGTAASTNVDVAFRRNNIAAGKIGTTSTSFGVGALTNGASTNSTAIGNNALSVSSGNNNVAVGQFSLLNCNTTAQWNTAVGNEALKSINSNAAQANTAVGYQSLSGGTGNFSNCTAVGFQALFANTNTGINNTAIGYQAGNNITIGYNNTAIGFQAVVPIGSNPNQVRIGNTAVSYAGIQVAWSITSDKRYKSNIQNSNLGLDFVNSIRPVSYLRENDKKTEYGFIAQELELSLNNFGDSNNGIITKDDKGFYSVRYNDFIPITVKAIQEQQLLIEELQKSYALLQKTNEIILKRLEALEKQK